MKFLGFSVVTHCPSCILPRTLSLTAQLILPTVAAWENMGVEPGNPVGLRVKRLVVFGAFLQSSLVVRPGTSTTPWLIGSIQAGRP